MRTEKEINKEFDFWVKVMNARILDKDTTDGIKLILATLNWVKGEYDNSTFYNLYGNKSYYKEVEENYDD